MIVFHNPRIRRFAWIGAPVPWIIAWLLCLSHMSYVRAGGGPENVLVVVNRRSESSKTIANHYIFWRRIPAINVVHIDWNGDIESCSADQFRNNLWQPIRDAMELRGIEQQIDYIVYSSDFPWRINFTHDFQDPKPPQQCTPWLSITGATYLWKYAVSKDPKLLKLDSNHYLPNSRILFDPGKKATVATPSQGFRSFYTWEPGGKRVKAGGASYYLSTMLAVTSGRGTRVDESLKYLGQSIRADQIRPRGTIYLMQRNEIRSKVRHDRFQATVDELGSLGIRAEILNGTLPAGKEDIAGLMLGAATFDLDQAKVKILPGAICDHLTSFGGILLKDANQTPLTEFLRHGAAGASGTVVEPLAIWQKFPLPSIHVHYAHGCSLAESFYQSVAAPFQLLIVGDPLCQPWADLSSVAVTADGIEPEQTVEGVISFRPNARFPKATPPMYFDLFFDGKRTRRIPPGQQINLDTRILADGFHELRIVAVEASLIERQGRFIVPVHVDNHGHRMEFTITPRGRASPDTTLTLSAQAEGAESIVFTHHQRVLGKITGSQGTIQVEAAELGPGPSELYATAIGSHSVAAKPLQILVIPDG
ncbi:MAG: TIGR03790 family protein [Pirellulales bacterium]|nr:TIGR03790 family protein [Pirellulales bacterium]